MEPIEPLKTFPKRAELKPETYEKWLRLTNERQKEERRLIRELLGNKCAVCGKLENTKEWHGGLEIHHYDEKRKHKGNVHLDELPNLVLLCLSCHQKTHVQRRYECKEAIEEALSCIEPFETYQWLAEELTIEVRTSAFCRYWWCAIQSFLMATQGIESPHEGYMDEGSDIHEKIVEARKPSPAEQEFLNKLAPFYADGKKISRTFQAEEAKLCLSTIGVDEWKVIPPNQVWIVEYKTKSSLDVTPVDLAPAIFQVKLYGWIHEPVLRQLGYKLMGGLIVFLRRKGIYPIGEVEVKIDYEDIEADMRHILHQFKHPEDLIPPKRWKCVKCPTVFKERCVFQK